MSDTVIRVENLGKKYIIGHQQQERYTALRDVITNKVKSIGSLINPQAKNENPAFEEFWALKDVSFDIKQGDRVGIIGRNGAGKSTLLKILSRITEPTKGSIKIKGRVASLLEVGTGFHPELTGRENIFLNGAILGMGKEEIKRKFDEIVDFAEVEKFLDTPVKRYSSGMYVRLAFAVAAHLEPEILIVDEVLAVGDAQFQKKCLGKMEDVGKEGRTVIFVSHNMQAVARLTNRCVVLVKGESKFDGLTPHGVDFYNFLSSDKSTKRGTYKANLGISHNHLLSATIKTSNLDRIHNWGEPITFEFTLSIKEPEGSLCFSFQVVDDNQLPVCHLWYVNQDQPNIDHLLGSLSQGIFRIVCFVPKFRLYMGSYTLTTWLSDRTTNTLLDHQSEICAFDVSMEKQHREVYEWIPKTCIYLEDFQWKQLENID